MNHVIGPYPPHLDAVRDLRRDLAALFEGAGIKREITERCLLGASEIATNIVRHARPSARTITVEIEINADAVTLAVVDDGGHAGDLRQRLGAARRAAGLEAEESGMGLGLLATLFARTDYRSEEGYNRLTLFHPLERATAPLIIIVEDDPVMSRLLRAYLEGPYRVRSFPSAQAAVAAMAEFTPDLVISDIDMPGLDGLSLRRWLQEDDRFAFLPFIFLTGLDCEEVETRANALGVDAFLTKPVSKHRITGLVERILYRARQLRETMAPKLDAAVTNSLRTRLPDRLFGLDLRLVERPAEVGGGDIVLLRNHDRHADLFLIDVMGHGLPAKLFAHLYAGFIHGLVLATPAQATPAATLAALSEAVGSTPDLDRSLMTCLLLRLHEDGLIEIANAGHPRPFVVAQGQGRELSIDGPLLGLGPDSYEILRLRLAAGERLIAFTDGLLDGLGGDARNLSGVLAEPPDRLLDRVGEAITAGIGRNDDLTILTVRADGA
jgi:DNA-binding response OmpR family regulator/anti-sigma regulatory factor (Ser/Thr protein kinase)